jgi:predicted porin
MNKKLIAVAVAGVLAAPAAFAQSSVTISGLLKGGFESLKLSNTGLSRGNSSQTGVVDDSSRIIFNVVEDLGGGLQAIGQLDIRVKPDDAGGVNSLAGASAGAFNTSNIVSGNSHFGLRSKDWGRIFFGRQDLHYFNTESNLSDKASLRANSISLLSFIGGGAIAGATRTQNVIHYTTPNWSGFTLIAAYSSNPGSQETDIGAGTAAGCAPGGVAAAPANCFRKGSAWNLNPNFAAANWQVGYSYWTSKPDAAMSTNAQVGGGAVLANAAPVDQRADRLYGSYVFPMGIKIGLAWDKSRLKSTVGAGDIARRSAWSIPVSYTWGNHSVHVHYTKANDEQVAAGDQGANMWALAYAYDLSKRTSAAVTYARINNKNPNGAGVGGGTYNFFTSGALGLGGSAGAMQPGEDPRMWGFTLRHAF